MLSILGIAAAQALWAPSQASCRAAKERGWSLSLLCSVVVLLLFAIHGIGAVTKIGSPIEASVAAWSYDLHHSTPLSVALPVSAI